jgi:hypothetical protein
VYEVACRSPSFRRIQRDLRIGKRKNCPRPVISKSAEDRKTDLVWDASNGALVTTPMLHPRYQVTEE